MSSLPRSVRGFSLVETMIVVAILGLLAAVALPQFTSHRQEGRTAAMVSGLSILRTAIDSYWTQHDGFPGPDAESVTRQLLGRTDKAGKVGTTADCGYGPYLRNGALPENPFTGTRTLKVVEALPAEASGGEAWVYCPKTGEVRSNAPGRNADGVPYFDF